MVDGSQLVNYNFICTLSCIYRHSERSRRISWEIEEYSNYDEIFKLRTFN